MVGIEPTTFPLPRERSTTELHRRGWGRICTCEGKTAIWFTARPLCLLRYPPSLNRGNQGSPSIVLGHFLKEIVLASPSPIRWDLDHSVTRSLFLVGMVGIEPTTSPLSGVRSTTELHARHFFNITFYQIFCKLIIDFYLCQILKDLFCLSKIFLPGLKKFFFLKL